MDLMIKNARLPDGRSGIDLLARAGRIEAIGVQLPVPAGAEVIDAGGQLLSPPFVDAHFHMDATLSYGLPRANRSGTLLEGIALWGELKPQLTQEALVERALPCEQIGDALRAQRPHVHAAHGHGLGARQRAAVGRVENTVAAADAPRRCESALPRAAAVGE